MKDLFLHFKGMPYLYHGLVRHSETLEEYVFYETLYENKNGKLWIRPKDMFFEKIEREGRTIQRFRERKHRIDFIHFPTDEQLHTVKNLNQIIFPDFDEESFKRRLAMKNSMLQIFYLENAKTSEMEPVAFKFGYPKGEDHFHSSLGGVSPTVRGLGIAAELMKTQHQWCKDKGFKKITTNSKNIFVSMMKLNLDHGFKIVGYSADTDKIHMLKDLVTT